MHTLIENLFKKRGIQSVDDLQSDEKTVFDRYQKILSNDVVTIEQMVEFIKIQKGLVEQKFELDNKPGKAKNLELLFTVYSKLLNMIEGPRAERESLIKYLESQLDTPNT